MRVFTLLPLLCLLMLKTQAQSTFIPLGTEEYQTVERSEAASGANTELLNTSLKPYSRKQVADYLKQVQDFGTQQLNSYQNPTDIYNVQRALALNGEYSPRGFHASGSEQSSRPILKYFYTTKSNFFEYADDDFFIAVNPVLYLQAAAGTKPSGFQYINTRGAEVRANLFGKIGLYTLFADHQSKAPNSFTEVGQRWHALPGFDYFKGDGRSQAFDALMVRGYISLPIYKEYITASFGYDKQFIGEGIRSMLLSDAGAASTYLRIRYKYKRWDYQNVFTELHTDYIPAGDRILPKKYAAFHYLSYNISPKLNIGLFESTIFGNNNEFAPSLLTPIIGYHSIAQGLEDSRNKTSLGINAKAYPAKNLQIYAQAYFNSFDFQNMGEGSYKNQYATQLGLKYFNAFSVPQLDLQVEWNFARPFTYASIDSINDYTHYNQPLAHPLENGFSEYIASAKYQWKKKLYLSGLLMLVQRYEDRTQNNATGIFAPIGQRLSETGYKFSFGRPQTAYINFNASYELAPNLFLDAGAIAHAALSKVAAPARADKESRYLYFGLRMNISRQQYAIF